MVKPLRKITGLYGRIYLPDWNECLLNWYFSNMVSLIINGESEWFPIALTILPTYCQQFLVLILWSIDQTTYTVSTLPCEIRMMSFSSEYRTCATFVVGDNDH